MSAIEIEGRRFDDEVDVGEFAFKILSEWRVVAFTLVGAVLVSSVYAFAVAPTQYQAEASLRGLVHAYCPTHDGCAVSLEDAISNAAQTVLTADGFEALDATLNLSADGDFAEQGEFSQERKRRNFFDAVNVEAEVTTASVKVTHSSDRRAVEIANAIVEFVASEVALRAAENYTRLDSDLRLRLATLPAPTAVMSQSEALISLERSSIDAQLQSLERHVAAGLAVAMIDRPASLPLEQIVPRRALILALGGVLGMFLGIGAAIVFSMRQGKLHSVGAIAGAFGGGDVIVARGKDIVDAAGHAFWQEVRVAFGEFEGGGLVVTGLASDDMMLSSALGLASEFARSDTSVAVVDLAASGSGSSTADEFGDGVSVLDDGSGIPIYRCAPRQLGDVMARLGKDGGVVIILPPSPDRDLASVREAIAASKGWVFLAKRGIITRHDVNRLQLAERGVIGRRVLAVI